MNKAELEKLICELLGIDQVNRMIKTQITRFTTKDGYSYKDIGRSLFYFVNVKKQKPDVSRGIGIVPFVKDDAHKYFEALKYKEQEQTKEARKIREGNIDIPIILVRPTRKDRGRRIINMEEL